ncbi:MAG: tetratricopeptide repeat protein [Inhella sp.]|jgi:tetratricopeptide (TPR) repeat protein|uniref:tetratricopeptide repeat protein n=1 Tax=Inhella sp. TaxID=1921806 RepID=UPI0022C9DE7D|nr:tetratricopeptide repeat protein [Inhella sp.]MCZ8235167.1 tetratricopeptide repeat protein [Inhella sp.]
MFVNWWWLRAQAWVLLAVGQRSAARRCFGRLQRLRPQDPFPIASCAYLDAQDGDWGLAADGFERLTQSHPTQAGHWFNLGFVREKLSDVAGAALAHARAVEIDPKLDLAWYGLGQSLLQLGRYEEAKQAFRRNTELQPLSPYGWTQLARLHAQRQEHEEAAQVLARLKEFEPRVAGALARELAMEPSQ